MESKNAYKEKFNELKCCVLIPTYNNDKTILDVVVSCLNYTDNIIVINDGCSDKTAEILKSVDNQVVVITHEINKGKGVALKTGFKEAEKLGYNYVIAIDSDGQHLPEDLPNFLEKIEQEPGALIVGERNMNQDHIPGGSTFGHKFSNFWFWAETGIKLPDTQSGYRLYPVKVMNKIWFFTGRYEFEIENIVRAAWKGVNVTSVPVSVIYQTGDDRVTHFKTKDFVRISLLNTVLVTLALLIFHPLRFIKGFNKQNIKRVFHEQVIAPGESNKTKAISVAFGLFMGIFPIWGFQFTLAILGAIYFKLNKVLVGVVANISVPPMIPVIIYSSYLTGGLFLNNPYQLDFSNEITLDFIHTNMMQYLIGAVILSVLLAVVGGGVSYLLLSIFRKNKLQNG